NRECYMLRPFAVLALVVLASPAAAQDSWPSKPVTVIVPFGAGGNTDALARIYSARLSARLGQQFVIENRIGAGSIIGITSLAKAAPDGYTIGVWQWFEPAPLRRDADAGRRYQDDWRGLPRVEPADARSRRRPDQDRLRQLLVRLGTGPGRENPCPRRHLGQALLVRAGYSGRRGDVQGLRGAGLVRM